MQFTLKELRARKNLTQKQVAKDLGISYQTYNAWEKDISGVAVSKVIAVANYFGVSIGQISFFAPVHENNSCAL
jgi:transcriptional regulator with XRE-family HTH domain